jgi:hypothetical protein
MNSILVVSKAITLFLKSSIYPFLFLKNPAQPQMDGSPHMLKTHLTLCTTQYL